MEKIVEPTTERDTTEVLINAVWTLAENILTNVNETELEYNPYGHVLMKKCHLIDIDEPNNICVTFDACKSNLSDLWKNYRKLEVVTKKYEKVNHDFIITMFYCGLFFGALGGGLLMFLICCLKDRNLKKTFERPIERQKLRQAFKDRSRVARKGNE